MALDLSDSRVIAPEHVHKIAQRDAYTDYVTRTRIHIDRTGGGIVGEQYDGNWSYAVLLYAVGGWTVVSERTDFYVHTPMTHDQVARIIADYYNDGGGSIDRIPRSFYYYAHGSGTATAHLRRDHARTAYCGKSITFRVDFSARTTSGSLVTDQHCINCDAAYRQEHYGRCAVTYGDDDTMPCGHVPDDGCDCDTIDAEADDQA